MKHSKMVFFMLALESVPAYLVGMELRRAGRRVVAESGVLASLGESAREVTG
jgi:hypothetical protein